MRGVTKRVLGFGSVRRYTQQPFHLGKALKLVQDLPSPADAINRVSVALGLTEPPSMDKLTQIVKEIDGKWDYDNHVKFNKVLYDNIQVVTKEFILEHCRYAHHIGRFFNHNRPLATNLDFIKQLINNGANIAYFMRSVNEINQLIRVDSKIDPHLLEFQFEYLKTSNSSTGAMGYIPEDIRSEYLRDDSFIERYLGYFNRADWMYIVDVRKDDREFIKKYWINIDHEYYFLKREKFTYDAVKQVMDDGYIDKLSGQSWEMILQQVEKDGQLELLYELCGPKILFTWITFEGDSNVLIANIPNIENVRDETVLKILDRAPNRSLAYVSPKHSDDLNNKLAPLGLVYNDNPTYLKDHVTNMVFAITATYAFSLSGKALSGSKVSTQMQCSNTLKRVLPIYLNSHKKPISNNSIVSDKN